jgi:mono/diheme cytochrome c family protein
MKFKIAGLILVLSPFFHYSSAQVTHAKTPVSGGSSVARGKIVYKQICVSCHMADGVGFQQMNPPLIKTSYVLGNKATLIKIVLNGFKEDVEINGEKYTNNMTPHSDLKDQEIADVLTYVRNSFGNKASAVTATEVKKVRAANKTK